MDQVKKTPVVLVLFAWLLVGTPWAWGVTQLWKNAKKLFIATPPAVTTTAPSATVPVAPASTPVPAAPSK